MRLCSGDNLQIDMQTEVSLVGLWTKLPRVSFLTNTVYLNMYSQL